MEMCVCVCVGSGFFEGLSGFDHAHAAAKVSTPCGRLGQTRPCGRSRLAVQCERQTDADLLYVGCLRCQMAQMACSEDAL